MRRHLLTYLALIYFASLKAQSNSIEVWMRAFIPDPQHAGGGTGFISALPSGGSCVSIHNANASIPNMCYATDNRSFSTSQTSTARLETKFTLTLNADGTGNVVPSQNRTVASITKKVDCTTGKIIEQKQGSIDRDDIGAPAVADGKVQVIGQVQGRNLLTPLGPNGPAIDYSFDIQWQPSTSTLIYAITIGSFPAFEMYARQPGGTWKTIINQLPTGAPWQLGADAFGLNSMRITNSIVVSSLTGKWQTPSPDQRFAFEFLNNKVKWIEKNQSGSTLTKEVEVLQLPDGRLKIERQNADEVLTFLGFQKTLRSEILARNPQPSFVIFSFAENKILAEWNGLSVTKDDNAHLKELFQPGSKPPRVFELEKNN